MKNMNKSKFVIQTDIHTGKRFVCKAVDELNKIHNDLDRELHSNDARDGR